MKCKTCNSNMTLLFISWACDVCDNKKNNSTAISDWMYTYVNSYNPDLPLVFFKHLEACKAFGVKHKLNLPLIKKPHLNMGEIFIYDSHFGDEVISYKLGNNWEYW